MITYDTIGLDLNNVQKIKTCVPNTWHYSQTDPKVIFVNTKFKSDAPKNKIIILIDPELRIEIPSQNYALEFMSPQAKILKNPSLHNLPILYTLYPIKSFIEVKNINIRYPINFVDNKSDLSTKFFYDGSFLNQNKKFINELNSILESDLVPNIVFVESDEVFRIKINGRKKQSVNIFNFLSKIYRNKKNLNINQENDKNLDKLNISIEETDETFSCFIFVDAFSFNIKNVVEILEKKIL